MSRKKHRLHKTDPHHLVSNLRGEVGEIVTSWTLWRHLTAQASQLRTPDILADLNNRSLVTLEILCGKLQDEMVARLSELAERKIGRLNFHFAAVKLDRFADEVRNFASLVQRYGLDDKRNKDISHKELPETWSDHKYRRIPRPQLVRCIASALRLMKRIDRHVLGPSAPYLWSEVRKKRYQPLAPPRVMYMLLPYMRLSEATRVKVIGEEMAEGRSVWSPLDTTVDGKIAQVLAAKEWGAIRVGSDLIMLSDYPIQQVKQINTRASAGEHPAPDA